MNPDPAAVAALGLVMLCFIGYALHLSISARKFDRIIAEKEAAMNAPDEAATPR